MKPLHHLSLAVIGLALSVSAANATTIYQGTIYNDSGFLGGYESYRATNQSGLSVGYTSGVTNYDAYVALNPTHLGSSTGVNGALDTNSPAFIDLDFGSALNFTDFGLWNDNDYQGIKDFRIRVSNDSTFAISTTSGIFTAYYNSASNPNGGSWNYSDPLSIQQFDLGSATGRYVRLEILDAHLGSTVNFGEFIFGAGPASVPESGATLALLGLALSGLGFSRRFLGRGADGRRRIGA